MPASAPPELEPLLDELPLLDPDELPLDEPLPDPEDPPLDEPPLLDPDELETPEELPASVVCAPPPPELEPHASAPSHTATKP